MAWFGEDAGPLKLPNLHPASRDLIPAKSGPATEPIAHLIPDLSPVPVVASFEGMGVLDKVLSDLGTSAPIRNRRTRGTLSDNIDINLFSLSLRSLQTAPMHTLIGQSARVQALRIQRFSREADENTS